MGGPLSHRRIAASFPRPLVPSSHIAICLTRYCAVVREGQDGIKNMLAAKKHFGPSRALPGGLTPRHDMVRFVMRVTMLDESSRNDQPIVSSQVPAEAHLDR